MGELAKVNAAVKTRSECAAEILLVVDATNGQQRTRASEQFHEAID